MARLHNKEYLKPIRKYLRKKSTAAEATLWKMLRKGKVGGYKFRRQHSIGKFILDFYCSQLRLCIELDGEPHADLIQIQKDKERDDYLKSEGITVLRYENRWVYEYPDVISEDILKFARTGKIE